MKSPPTDLITSVNFIHDALYVTSFTQIKVYQELTEECQPRTIDAVKEPVLDATTDGNSLYVGLLSGSVYKVAEPPVKLAQHADGVQTVVFNDAHRLLITGSWDRTAKIIPLGETGITELHFDGKVQSCDTTGDYVVFGISSGKNIVYDLRNYSTPAATEGNGFKLPLTTTIAMIPSGGGYVQGSMEGKVSVNTFSPQEKYTFKCHRTVLSDDVEFIGPVNDISFCSPTRFFTGGSNVDRKVCMWDYTTKKRVKQFKNLPLGVARLKYNQNLRALVVAMSDDSFKNSVSLDDPTLQLSDSIITVIHV